MSKLITKISPDKIKDKSYLLHKIQQKHQDWNTPKCTLLMGAGCSYPILPLGSGLIKLCQQLCFICNSYPAEYTAIKSEFLKHGDIKKPDEFINIYKSNEDGFNKYITEQEKYLLNRLRENKETELAKITDTIENALWEEFEQNTLADARYSYWMNKYSESPKERQRLIEALIENKKPRRCLYYIRFIN